MYECGESSFEKMLNEAIMGSSWAWEDGKNGGGPARSRTRYENRGVQREKPLGLPTVFSESQLRQARRNA